TDEQPLDYSFLPRFDAYPDDFLEIESDAYSFDEDRFNSKGEKIKESKLLIDQLDLPCDILPYSEYDSFNSQDFSRDVDLPSPDTEDKVRNKQEPDKIRTKLDQIKEKREAWKSPALSKPITVKKERKMKKMQVKGQKMQTPTKLLKKEERKGLKLQFNERRKRGARSIN
nr:hypothetical protein [Tanacetum cinerariifolium]